MITMYAGDTLNITIPVTENGNPVDLSGATVKWRLDDIERNTATINTNDFVVKIVPADTEGKHGNFTFEAEITDQAGNVSTVVQERVYIMKGEIT
ncbi:hypothetical protein [Sediminibacillus massiliensis]|uniref:hypothetical protein n=1 Tax=Sediminibacillus massiliensis TaxID=1926277 RepID=UPI00098877B1|nr:hypothetical protein [Sediminibacillus massiliensis]